MAKNEFEKLVNIIERLRDPEKGCPWDLEQTPRSLYPLMIDEVYEIVEAIQKEDAENLKEELGDLILHIILQTQIAKEEKKFTIQEVLQELNQKLIRRHPHVFGQGEAKNPKEVMENWEKIKEKEGKKKAKKVYSYLPALVQAYRMIEDHADWKKQDSEILQAIHEDLDILSNSSSLSMEEEEEKLGKILFEMALWITQKGKHPEEILKRYLQNLHKQKKNSGEKEEVPKT
ncbi:MAG: MazG family protein [Planctomycetota bacterium]|nr:MAG: MazG family protein [Planctomycetota bacterium]